MNDSDRFKLALSQITGKRLTLKHLTGKDRETDTARSTKATEKRKAKSQLALSGCWLFSLGNFWLVEGIRNGTLGN